uniref:RNA2 polyprotein n=2 Tax=Comovirus TaxID=12258 RepID=A0A8F8N4C8_9SECO|nr:polyprotein [Turnip ringspot virus]
MNNIKGRRHCVDNLIPQFAGEPARDFSYKPQEKYVKFLKVSPFSFLCFLIVCHIVTYYEILFKVWFEFNSWIGTKLRDWLLSITREANVEYKRLEAISSWSAGHQVTIQHSFFVKKMETVMERGIAAKALELRNDAAMNKGKRFVGLKDHIPAGKDLYVHRQKLFEMLKGSKRSREVDISRIKGCEVVEMKHIDVGTLSPGENQIINVKIVKDDMLPQPAQSDYAMVTHSNESKYANAMHVGAIEVIFNSYASPTSDIVGGMILVDTCHKSVANAVRSVFVTGLAGGKLIRVLMYPNTLVEIGPKMNDRFKLVCTTSNSDISEGFNLASVKVNVVGCTQSLMTQYVPQPLLDNLLNKEQGTVVEYLGQLSYVMHHSNHITEEFLANQTMEFDLGKKLHLTPSGSGARLAKSTSMRYVVGPKQKLLSAEDNDGASNFDKRRDEARKSVGMRADATYVDPVFGMTQRAFGQASTTQSLLNKFASTRQMEGTPIETKIARTKIILTKVMSGGTILYTERLSDVLSNVEQRAAVAFQRTHVQHKKLVALATINVPENTGCALMMCYNSGIRGKAVVDAYTASAEASTIWNPACQQQARLEINVNPCKSAWSYQFLRQSKGVFNVVCISGWTTTPSTDLSLTIDWYLSDKDAEPETYCAVGINPKIVLNRWMGKLSFPQGTEVTLRRMPLAIGGGAGGTGLVYMNMPNALCSLWRYMRGGMFFEVIKLSSPYIKATIAFFIAFTDVDATVPNLEAYPHKLVQFSEIQERVTISFDKEDFVMAWSTQVHNSVPLSEDGCPYLYAVVHDSVGSTIPGDFNIGVVLKEMNEVESIGRHPGWKGARPLAVSPQGLRKSPSGVWNELFMVRGPPEAKSTDVVQFAIDLVGVGIATKNPGTWSIETNNSPMNNLMRTATWKSGTFHFQVLMEGNPLIKRGDWSSYCEVSLTQSTKVSTMSSRNWVMKDPSSWELEFDIKIEGPNDGFENWESHFSNQTSWFLVFSVFNPDQSTVFVVNGMIDDNCWFAGNTLMPPFLEPESVSSRHSFLSSVQFDYGTTPGRRAPSLPPDSEDDEGSRSERIRRLERHRERDDQNRGNLATYMRRS